MDIAYIELIGARSVGVVIITVFKRGESLPWMTPESRVNPLW
jgi:hypothetical protein